MSNESYGKPLLSLASLKKKKRKNPSAQKNVKCDRRASVQSKHLIGFKILNYTTTSSSQIANAET
ncbi:MAG TPA: hypothetical protein DDW68_02935 [Verrucomicrobiales bacterium]|nr:hypothetical protein [Verrucomicrobiales bacterium]HBE96113.1 hypothetical protein [Verrucomicrobiales bacterium]